MLRIQLKSKMTTKYNKVLENHHDTTPKRTAIHRQRDDSNLFILKRSYKNTIKKQMNTNYNFFLENDHYTTPNATLIGSAKNSINKKTITK